MEELKDCPFCGAGGKGIYLQFDGTSVWCNFCNSIGPPGYCNEDNDDCEFIEKSAVLKWNRR